jgi:hypothetical protein
LVHTNRQAHELPGWYRELAEVTPQSAWTEGDHQADLMLACAELGPGPAVLRDYVKSMKHYGDEAAFIPDIADTAAAWKIASRFRELREEIGTPFGFPCNANMIEKLSLPVGTAGFEPATP